MCPLENKVCVTGTRTIRVLETIKQFPIRITTLAIALMAAGSLFMAAPPAAAQTGLGYALAFDGVDDSVYVAPHPALDLTTGTIEFWVKPGNLTGNACIQANRGWTEAQTRFSVHLATNAIGLFDGTALRTVPFSAAAGQWYHIALVCSGGDTEVFVDGISRGFTGNAFNPNVTGQPLNLGATYDNTGTGTLAERFTGTLDEVRLWNVARTPAEITNHLRLRLTGTESNLVACYRFDEAEGIIAYDATTNHCHGKLINRPRRIPSYWWPLVTLAGADRLTNECHESFVDSGASATASLQAIATGASHSLAIQASSTIIGWGGRYFNYGQTNGALAGSNVVAISAGHGYSLALKADGTVVGWGYNLYGEANGAMAGSNVVAIAAGYHRSLALRTDSSVVTWGYDANGLLIGTNFVAIAAGYSHNLALRTDGTVTGWGDNSYNEANGALAGSNVVAIAVGGNHSLALRADGTVTGWGRNDYGQANGTLAGSNVVAIAAGAIHSLALRADGTVVGWGDNRYGQANGVPAGSNVVAIAGGGNFNLVLRADGRIIGWGDNLSGRTNVPASVYNLNLPITVSGKVDTNVPGTCEVYYSVTNALGAVGTATRTVVVTDTRLPELTLLGENPLMISLGTPFKDPGATATDLCAGDLTAIIESDLTVNPNLPGVYTNTYTVRDASGNTASATRTVVVGLPLATTLAVSNTINDAATLNGTVNPCGSETAAWFEWGTSTRYGNTTEPMNAGIGTNALTVGYQLNALTPGIIYHYRVVASNSAFLVRGTDQVFWAPVLRLNSNNTLTNECHVSFVDTMTVNASPLAIAAGWNHSLAIKADGTVAGWGKNEYALANGALAGTNVVAIAAGYFHNLALEADGTVIGWGRSDYIQSNGSLAGTNVVAIAVGTYHSLALKTDGTVVGWGDNTYGQTNGTEAGSNVVEIAAGAEHSLALRADGTVVGWGRNNYGQVNGVMAGSNVKAITAGGNHSLALRANGTVVGWGYSIYAQANGLIAGSNVVAIAAGGNHSLALKADGTVVGWGLNNYGQTNGALAGSNVVAIAAGGNHSLALRADGTLVSWGSNLFGQTNVPGGVFNSNLPIAVSGTVDANVPGTYELTYRVTNALGAVGTATRTVVVADTRPPDLTMVGNNPLMITLGTPFADPGATATDLCAGDLTGSIVSNLTVNPNLAGVYTNTYMVTDASGNQASIHRTVLVVTESLSAGCVIAAPGQLRLNGPGIAGLTYTVQVSTNLVDWVDHASVTAGPDGVIDYVEALGTDNSARFYRLKWP